MLARKLRNHAIRRYPKNFDKTEVAEFYQQTFEDEKYIKSNVIDAEEIIVDSEIEFQEKANIEKPKGGVEQLIIEQEENENLQEFDIEDVEIPGDDDVEKLIEEETQNDIHDTKTVVNTVEIKESKTVEEKPKETQKTPSKEKEWWEQ
jgi:hypothetical protein